jgi:hypothetical protein
MVNGVTYEGRRGLLTLLVSSSGSDGELAWEMEVVQCVLKSEVR